MLTKIFVGGMIGVIAAIILVVFFALLHSAFGNLGIVIGIALITSFFIGGFLACILMILIGDY